MKSKSTQTKGINKLAFRLFQRYRGRMLFFASSIAIGIGFLFAIGNLLDVINASIAEQTRTMMGADVTISSARPFDTQAQQAIKKITGKSIRSTKIIEFNSMLRPLDAKKVPALVFIKAIRPNYPFYGDLIVKPASYKKNFFKGAHCLIAEELVKQHGLKVGEKVRLGRSILTITGIIKKEPGQVLSTSLAPRIIIPTEIIKATGLVQFGSRIKYIRLLAFSSRIKDPKAASKKLKGSLEKSLQNPYIRIRSYADAQPTLREAFQRVSIFFIFVSLVTLLLGAIGMAASVTAFLNEQIRTVGIFRCVGLSPSDVNKLYNRLCIGIGLLGGVLGVIFGLGLSYIGIEVLQKFWSSPLQTVFHWSNFVEALIISSVLTIGLNYLSVWTLSRLPPQNILGQKTNTLQLPKWGIAFTLLGLGAIFYLYSLQSSNSVQMATFFSSLLLGMILLSLLLILLGLWLLGKLESQIKGSSSFTFILRHGIRQLVRQRTRSLTFLLALTIGITLIGCLNLLQYSLVTELQVSAGRSLPDLFLIDVQKSQVPSVKKLIQKYAKKSGTFSPLVRARLTHINGKAIKIGDLKGMTLEQKSRARFLSREYNLTYKDRPNQSETIIKGKLWSPGSSKLEISLEKRFAARLEVSIKDRLQFDILGKTIEGTVTSIREINWTSLMPNFFVAFPTKVLEKAPQTLITSIAINSEEKIRSFQQELGKVFPNITTVPLGKILGQIQGLLAYLILAMKMLAWVCVAVGMLILAGTLSTGRAERREKVALFRTLGCQESIVRNIDTIEFITIGVLTSAITLGVTYLLGQMITRQMLISFHIAPIHVLEIMLASFLMPMLVGYFSNRKIYQASVMENLRSSL